MKSISNYAKFSAEEEPNVPCQFYDNQEEYTFSGNTEPVGIELSDVSPYSAFLNKWDKTIQLNGIEKEVLILKERLARQEQMAVSIIPIQSLSPSAYNLLKPIYATLESHDDDYLIRFVEANISASGDTREEAVFNFKDMLIGTYEVLSCSEPESLSIILKNQLSLLSTFIQTV